MKVWTHLHKPAIHNILPVDSFGGGTSSVVLHILLDDDVWFHADKHDVSDLGATDCSILEADFCNKTENQFGVISI